MKIGAYIAVEDVRQLLKHKKVELEGLQRSLKSDYTYLQHTGKYEYYPELPVVIETVIKHIDTVVDTYKKAGAALTAEAIRGRSAVEIGKTLFDIRIMLYLLEPIMVEAEFTRAVQQTANETGRHLKGMYGYIEWIRSDYKERTTQNKVREYYDTYMCYIDVEDRKQLREYARGNYETDLKRKRYVQGPLAKRVRVNK